MSKQFELPVRFARRIPDPVFSSKDHDSLVGDRHVFVCAVEALPKDLPKDPNPRAQQIDKGIWRTIRKHLMNAEGTPNTFHLKNKGITLLATKVEKVSDDLYRITFRRGEGVVDGGHTYDLIIDCQGEIAHFNEGAAEEDKICQYVRVEVLERAESDIASEIAGGLNTAVQVQKMSLEDLKDSFNWMKAELEGEPYYKDIAFRENESTEYDARDLLCLLDMFNVTAFPNSGGDHPVRAYSAKAGVLDYYLAEGEKDGERLHLAEYQALRPILKDILQLHDIINFESRELHNEAGGKFLKLAFVEKRERGVFKYHFTQKEAEYRLTSGAAYPMLAAFRWCVDVNPKAGTVKWRGGFKHVLKTWRAAGPELLRATQATSDSANRKASVVGRSAAHWANLHNIVAKHSLVLERN